jgi:2-polyprenyl-3-methyl-5-hydroxy-6-metoxy-1,4-benzoquinol methylase
MPSFLHRSYQKELLDRDDIPFEDIRRNMQELSFINSYLGGHRITLKGFKAVAQNYRNLHIVEIGSGGGDNLMMIKKWAHSQGISLQLTGIDINPECVLYARTVPGNSGMNFIHSDFREVQFKQQPDIIFSSLFCHHFNEQELTTMLRWMHDNSKRGFFINDLHRHPAAYYSIQLLTRLFSRSYLVKHDAPLSVRRGFVKQEWERLLQQADITGYKISWNWAFRWLVTVCKK